MTRSPRFVVDIGTGTGLWALDFARQNPSSYVIGTDLSAIQPPPDIPNVHFTKDDAEDEWVFPLPAPLEEDGVKREDYSSRGQWITFDYIHLRLTFSCFMQPNMVLGHAYNNLNPGGWIEFQETALDIYQANPEFPGKSSLFWASLQFTDSRRRRHDALGTGLQTWSNGNGS